VIVVHNFLPLTVTSKEEMTNVVAQEMANALTMASPLFFMRPLPAMSDADFLLLVVTIGTICASMRYHLHNAIILLDDPQYDTVDTHLRRIDQTTILLSSLCNATVISGKKSRWTGLSALATALGLWWLWVEHGRGLRIQSCILTSSLSYILPMKKKAPEHGNAALGILCVFATCFRVGGWFHGVFHLLLGPYFHFVRAGIVSCAEP
jgi:hypothetical protein